MPSEEYGPTTAAPRCEQHGGAHALYQGQCIAMGAQVARPMFFSRRSWDCGCGARIASSIERLTLRRHTFDEATGAAHRCPPVVQVRVDEDGLARAIAEAVRALVPPRQTPAPAPAVTAPAEPLAPPMYPRGALGGIPRLGQ